MKRATTFASVALAALMGAALLGCDDKTAEHKTVDKAPDGTKVTETEKVKQDDNSTKVTHEKDVDRPGADAPGDHTKETVKTETK
jgi:hypothetical protein